MGHGGGREERGCVSLPAPWGAVGIQILRVHCLSTPGPGLVFFSVNYYSSLALSMWDCSIFTGALGKVYCLWFYFPLE